MDINLIERARIVKAMEVMIGSVNYEDLVDPWLMCGVADGDIQGDTTLKEIVEMGYCEDQTFKDLMTLFSKIMFKASGNGGLYCDGIVSDTRYVEWR